MYRSTRVTLVLASPYHITYPEGPSIRYVITFLDVFETTHYVSINTVLNVSKKLPISVPIPPSADVIYGWPLTQRPTGTDGEKMD